MKDGLGDTRYASIATHIADAINGWVRRERPHQGGLCYSSIGGYPDDLRYATKGTIDGLWNKGKTSAHLWFLKVVNGVCHAELYVYELATLKYPKPLKMGQRCMPVGGTKSKPHTGDNLARCMLKCAVDCNVPLDPPQLSEINKWIDNEDKLYN